MCGTNVPRRAPARARRRPGQKAAHFAQVQRGSWTGRRHQRQGSQAPARPAEAVTRNRRRKLRLSAPAFHRRTGHPDVRGHLSHRPTGRALRHGSALPNRASVARSYAGRAAAMSRFVMFSGPSSGPQAAQGGPAQVQNMAAARGPVARRRYRTRSPASKVMRMSSQVVL